SVGLPYKLSLHGALPIFAQVVVANTEPGNPLALRGRVGSHDVHDAANRVVPEKGSLRPEQHFDPIDIHQHLVEVRRPPLVDAIRSEEPRLTSSHVKISYA